MPTPNPEIVVLVPVPVVVTLLGFRVKVHVPVLGKPFSTTLPVETVQVGCVSVFTEGVLGLPAFGLRTIFSVGDDTQPEALVTV